MKAKNKVLTKPAETLISIIKAVTEVDPNQRSRDREVIFSRQMFYKIFRESEGWSYFRLGSIFGQDHATVRNAIIKLDNLMSYDKAAKGIYEEVRNAYTQSRGEVKKMESSAGVSVTIYEKLLQTNELIIKQNQYISEMKEEIRDLKDELALVKGRNIAYKPLVDLMLDRLPQNKISEAKDKMRRVFNGL